ncbi:caspase family protein [Bradyrhizobium sp. STM 3557]|uniref:caspase family protein n=1 Tax=Bradyrhizobium sp. STM 3557 TaxID=578920 RepID=UPI0038905FD5
MIGGNGIGAVVKVIGLRSIFLLILILAASLNPGKVHAQGRVALVVGNATYLNAPALRNSGNDADDISQQLQRLGFDVLDGRNLDGRAMRVALARFAQKLKGSDAALFYYSGHGLQMDGQNYLVPIDTPVDGNSIMPFDLVKLDDVIEALSYSTGTRLLILDACRSNPFTKSLAQRNGTRGGEVTRGLARIERTQGMLIAYSTQANMIAADGSGRNSPFTQALLRELQEPGLEVGTLFRRVAIEVNRNTQGQQTPELSVSLLGEFYLNQHESDIDAWKRLGPSANAAALKEFISKYPSSTLVGAAQARIDVLEIAGERERLIREYQEKEQQLRRELDQAEEGFRKASNELKQIRQRNESIAADKDKKAGSGDQPAAVAAAPEAERREQDRLAMQVSALEANKKRLEEERASLERALQDKLMKTQSDRARAEQRIWRENGRSPAIASETRAAPTTRSAASCQDLTARAQLGDITDADRSALRLCR